MMGKVILKPKVIFFDVIETLLDINSVKSSVARLLGGRADLADAWFSNMLLYSLVDTLTDNYHDFGRISLASFEMIARANGVEYDQDKVVAVLLTLNQSPAHADVFTALERLRNSGYHLVTLTNSSNASIQKQLANSGLNKMIDSSISIEDIGYFKPHPHTYRTAARLMGVEPSEAMLVAAHGWDIAGAQSVGMRSAFLHRKGCELYPLAAPPDFDVQELGQLADELI